VSKDVWHAQKIKEYKKMINFSVISDMKDCVQKEIASKSLWSTFNSRFNLKFKKEGKLGEMVDADSINNYYCEMGFCDGAVIEDTLSGTCSNKINASHFRVKSVNTRDIYIAWKSLRKKLPKTPDTTGISKYFLDKIIYMPAIAEWLVKIMNESFESGQIPDFMKLARVVPIPKIENANLPADFRPISILPVLLLLMEKIYYAKLVEYLEEKKILSNSQFGCRKYHSPEVAMVATTDFILKHLDKGLIAVIVSIDLRKAFDSVHREKLLRKLEEKYGISSHWLRSYLQNRYQFVDVNGKKSGTRKVLIGVPAGSILGSILFALFINDMPEVVNNGEVVMFVDDSNVIFVGNIQDLSKLKDCINQDMKLISDYFKDNRLTINQDKTKMITISSSRKSKLLADFSFEFEGFTVTNAKTLKCLGIIFDRTLTWSDHIENAAKICFIRMQALYRVRDVFTLEQMKTLCQALIFSIINYMLIIVGSTAKKYLKIYDKIVRSVSRLVLRVRKFDPVAEKIKIELKWLLIDNMYEYNLLRFMYGLCNYERIPAFSDYVRKVDKVHRYSTRTKNKCSYIFSPRLEIGTRVIQYKAVRLWNMLPEEIREAKSIGIFKKMLKNHLLSQ